VERLSTISLSEAVSFPHADVVEADLSCDGSRVLYTHAGELHLIDSRGEGDCTLCVGRRPSWSPAAPDTFAFQKPGDGGLWVCTLGGAERRLHTQIDDVDRFAWSADGTLLALIGSRQLPRPVHDGGQADGSILEVRPSPPGQAGVLHIVDSRTGLLVSSTEAQEGETFHDVAWHPNGRQLTATVIRDDPESWSWRWGLFDVELGTGRRQTRLDFNIREVRAPAWAPDGHAVAFIYCPHPYGSCVRTVCGLMAEQSQEVRALGDEYLVSSARWATDNVTLVCDGWQGTTKGVFQINTESGQTRRVMDAPGRSVVHALGSAQGVLVSHRGFLSLSDLYLVSWGDNTPRRLTQFSDVLQKYRLSAPELFSWESADGLVLEGLLIPSLHASAGKPAPTIVNLHGGPSGGGDYTFDPIWQWFAANGFQVFLPVLRGSQKYRWVPPPTDGPDCEDLLHGIERLISSGRCDPQRIGVHGFSYGASVAALAIGQSQCFRAAVLLGGHYDYRLTFGLGLQGGWNSTLAAEFGGKPWEVPETYNRLSPITWAPGVTAAVLLLHGENDVPEHAELYASALRSLGKEVELVVYKGSGHSPSEAEQIRDRWRRTMAWFQEKLGR